MSLERPDVPEKATEPQKTNNNNINNTAHMDRQEGLESLPLPHPKDNKKKPQLPRGLLPEDIELIAHIKGFKDGKKIKALYYATGIYGQGDPSVHDQTLCKKLAFYTNHNEKQMERILRSSMRYRLEWEALHGDITSIQMMIKKAIAASPDTYKPKKSTDRTGGGKKPVTTLEEFEEKYEVKKEYADGIGKEKFLYPNLITRNHILVIIALSGGGKTTFLYYHVAPQLAKAGYKVWYIDADSPVSDHPRMKAVADKYGFKFLIPDVNLGTTVESLIEDIEALADKGVSLGDQVFFFDTLKKFTSVMDKKSAKKFFVLLRRLTKLGATVVLPGHANKNRDSDGNLVFEGVGDIRSDTDELLFFERETNPDGSIDITTVVDPDKGAKVRGIFEPFSFNISKDREITFYNKPIDTISRSSTGISKATEDEIIQTAVEYVKKLAEPVKQSQLVEHTIDMLSGRAGQNKVREVIVQRSVFKGDPLKLGTSLICTIGSKNGHYYELPQDEPIKTEFEVEE